MKTLLFIFLHFVANNITNIYLRVYLINFTLDYFFMDATNHEQSVRIAAQALFTLEANKRCIGELLSILPGLRERLVSHAEKSGVSQEVSQRCYAYYLHLDDFEQMVLQKIDYFSLCGFDIDPEFGWVSYDNGSACFPQYVSLD